MRHAVDRMAADAGEMGHAHVALTALVDQRQTRNPRLVSEKADAHLIQEARVDLVDDLQMARQQLREHRERPALERLGQQRMVRVREGFARNVPGALPLNSSFVDQQAHELGDRNRRMRIV